MNWVSRTEYQNKTILKGTHPASLKTRISKPDPQVTLQERAATGVGFKEHNY